MPERRTAADVLAMAKPTTTTVRLVLAGGDLLERRDELEQELGEAVDEADTERITAEIAELDAELDAAEVEFVFKSIGRGRWRKLIADFPPSEDEKAQGADFAIDEFPFAAMAASLEEPRMTVDELKKLNDEILSFEQYQLLFGACMRVNLGSGLTRPESRAVHASRANGRHS